MTRGVAVAAVLGGSAYLVVNVTIESAFPDHWAGSPDRLLGWGYADWSRLLPVAPALLLVGFIGIHQQVRSSLGRVGVVGFLLTGAGLVLDIVGLVVEFWLFGLLLVPWIGEFQTGSGGSDLGYSINGLGTVLQMTGLPVYAVACLRAPVRIWWRAMVGLIAASTLSSLALYLANSLAIHYAIHGSLWILAGLLLLSEGTGRHRASVRLQR
jgi:hypothetical protein